jgi:hypothetical protein
MSPTPRVEDHAERVLTSSEAHARVGFAVVVAERFHLPERKT